MRVFLTFPPSCLTRGVKGYILKNRYTVLAQIVDTLKLHYYHGESTTTRNLIDYAKKINELKELKDEAYSIKSSNNDLRYIDTYLSGNKFRVMATTVSGFSVTIQNLDLSISFKTINSKVEGDYPENYDFNRIVDVRKQPVIRVEFRASFLARVGHENAIEYVQSLIRKNFFVSALIKVSEIHLATDIQGYNFHELDRQRFRTRKKTAVMHDQERENSSFYYFGKKFTGFSFGGGDDMIRIYNKSHEIAQNPDKAFIKRFAWEKNPNYDETKEVWRIEIQYRRAKLKTMYDETSGLLDGFENVINAIPSLWKRALDSFTLIDLSSSKCMEHFLGHDVDFKPIEQNTVRMRIQRANIHPLWGFISSWHFSIGSKIKILTAPVTGAFQWVGNSVKAFLSTLLKHYGDLSPALIEEAFNRVNDELIEDKGLNLVDNAVNNTLDYLGAVKRYALATGENGLVERDTFTTLQKNLAVYVREASLGAFDPYRSVSSLLASRSKILQNSFKKMVVA